MLVLVLATSFSESCLSMPTKPGHPHKDFKFLRLFFQQDLLHLHHKFVLQQAPHAPDVTSYASTNLYMLASASVQVWLEIFAALDPKIGFQWVIWILQPAIFWYEFFQISTRSQSFTTSPSILHSTSLPTQLSFAYVSPMKLIAFLGCSHRTSQACGFLGQPIIPSQGSTLSRTHPESVWYPLGIIYCLIFDMVIEE